jgi:lipid-A-disaccharide synthase
MRILVSAAEISSDIQAAHCIRALHDLLTASGVKVELAGIGGPMVRALPGFQCMEPAENLRSMGVGELLSSYLYIRKVGFRLIDLALEFQPDLFITFDYPNFHLEMMEKLQPRIKDNPIQKALKICAIPPKLWVWRSGRIKQIRRYYDGVLVVFPFEQDYYQKRRVPAIYEGNPLIAGLPFEMSREEAQKQLGCADAVAQGWMPVAVLPGSRNGELKHHLPLISPTLERAAQLSAKKLLALIPLAPGMDAEGLRRNLADSGMVNYRIVDGSSTVCLRAASVGLIKSGTSTLESVMLGCEPVIFYKTGILTELTFRLITRYLGPVGLPNILMGIKKRQDSVFSEFLGPEATPEHLAAALVSALSAPDRVTACQQQLRSMLVPHQDVPTAIARKLNEWLQQRPTVMTGRHI